MNGYAPGLALIERLKTTWKWIVVLATVQLTRNIEGPSNILRPSRRYGLWHLMTTLQVRSYKYNNVHCMRPYVELSFCWFLPSPRFL